MPGEIGTLIIGAGIGGLSLGYFLRGTDFLVLEKDEDAGGYLKQFRSGDCSFDVGVKCIHASSPEVTGFVEEVLGAENLDRGHVRSRFLLRGRLHALPRSERAVQPIGERPDFRSYALRNYGRLAESFHIPYAEKTWTAPASEIDYRAALGKSIPPGRYLYPRGGLQELTNRLAAALGDRVRLRAEVTRVWPQEREVVLMGGEVLRYKRLISTVPLPHLIALLEGVPEEVSAAAGRLVFNSMVTLALELEGETRADCHYVLVPERQYPFRRVSFPRNFSPSMVPPGRDSMLAEINLPRHDFHLSEDGERRGEFIQAVLHHLTETGLMRGCEVAAVNLSCVRLAHIVPDFHWRASLDTIERFLAGADVLTCGRFAQWRYMNIDHTINAARSISLAIRSDGLRTMSA